MRRRNAARANIAAVAKRWAAERPRLARDELEPLAARFVPRVNDEIERAMQRHRPDVARVQRDECAGGVTRAAINALRLVTERLSLAAVVWDAVEVIRVEISPRREVRQHALIRGEERFHVHGEVALHRQIPQRLDPQWVAEALDERAAGELL